LEVLETVVVLLAVDVVKLERDRLTEPFVRKADLAVRLLQAELQQPPFEVVAVARRGEQPVERHRLGTRSNGSAVLRIDKCLARETELVHAVGDAVPVVVIALDD
jgi:hypothetical protein